MLAHLQNRAMKFLKVLAILTMVAVIFVALSFFVNSTTFIDIAAGVTFYFGVPVTFFFSAIGPFLFIRKVMKKPFGVVNVLVATAIAAGLIALDVYLIYQGILWLAGAAFCDIYGC